MIDFKDIVERIEVMIQNEEEILKSLKNRYVGSLIKNPKKIKESEELLNHYKIRLEEYKKHL